MKLIHNGEEFSGSLAMGWYLGVTASHADTLDYRAMLARARARDEWKWVNAKPPRPEKFVETELCEGRSYRERFEELYGRPLA